MEGIGNLSVMLKMCLSELNYLKENIDVYKEVSAFTLEKVTKNWNQGDNDPATLVEYDSLCTSLSAVTNLARKLNLLFHLRNEGASVDAELPQMKIVEQASEEKLQCLPDSNNYENYSIPPIDAIEDNCSDSVEPLYNQINLDEFKPHCQITASISYVQDIEKLQFFICELNTEPALEILRLGKMKHLKQSCKFPSRSELFGLVLEGLIFRAVLANNSSNADDKNGCEALLIDLGELVKIDNDSIIYILPLEFQQIPAQAIPCALMQYASTTFSELQDQILRKYEKVTFEVVKNDGNILHGRFLSDNDDALKFMEIAETNPFKKDILKTVEKNNNHCNGLTEEELEMLYEEPLGTSNAMKAVLGYDPKDEKRICRFYNSKTNSCFKGSNCRQEHSQLLRDGWTKDVLPTYNVVGSIFPTVHYDVDALISITPTYIGELRQFYCQINDPDLNNEPLIWTSDDTSNLWALENSPMIFDIVLAKYKDGMWYRAKVVDIDDAGKQFKVFYIDYGNQDTVCLSNLRRCDKTIAQCPYQATLCRFVDFESTPKSKKKHKKALDLLRNTVLNKQVIVKVVYHSEELIVKIIDKEFILLSTEINKIIL